MKKVQTLVFPGFVNRSKPCIGGNTKVVSRLPALVGVSHRYLKPPAIQEIVSFLLSPVADR